MNRQFSFHEAAEREFIETASFFQVQGPEIGAAFIDEVEQAILQILLNPLSCQLVNRTARRKVFATISL